MLWLAMVPDRLSINFVLCALDLWHRKRRRRVGCRRRSQTECRAYASAKLHHSIAEPFDVVAERYRV